MIMLHPEWSGYSTLLLLLAFVTVAGCDQEGAYVEGVDAWHQERLDRLQAPDSWLSLAGLYWLEPGSNSFGAADTNDLVFPDRSVPGYLGSFIVRDTSVYATLPPESGVKVEGSTGTDLPVKTDASDEPTLFTYGPLVWHVIERDSTFAVRLKDRESPVLQDFAGIERYPVDPAWRVEGRFVPHDEHRMMRVPTVLGTTELAPSPGAVEFDREGETYRLDVIGAEGADRYWIIFADPTNRRDTYPAGRYVYIDAPSKGNGVTIDFNKSYNPPCAFTPYATCPFPPPQNRLTLPVEAGEKRYGGSHGLPHATDELGRPQAAAR